MFKVLAGLLLPLPLVLVFFLVRHDVAHPPAMARVSPVLSSEERLQRPTYHRRCLKSSECEAPLGCLTYPLLKQFSCTDSECLSDAQCGEDQSCQFIDTQGDGPRVGICVTQGVRREGEECVDLPSRHADACAPGLRCVENWCGRSCRTDTPESCPEGFFCADDGTGPVCLPTCEARGCPEGQECVRFPNQRIARPASTCRVVYGTNCRQTPCPPEQKCRVNHVPDRPGEVWMACMQRCGEERLACPDGLVCRKPYCRQPCDPQKPGACGPGMRCGLYLPGEPWVCRPDFTSPGETAD